MSFTPPAAGLIAGALAGYVLMMWTSPVRESLRDGWSAVRRYPRLWVILGVLGFAHALFFLGMRAYLATVLPESDRPVFMWLRGGWQDSPSWLSGTPSSLWWLPASEFLQEIRASLLPSIESLAGLFHNLVSTFPVSALVALAFLIPWRRRVMVLRRGLRRRFGWVAWMIYAVLISTAIAAVLKPFVYALPMKLPPLWWMHWGQVVAGLSFGFEYLLGVGIQVFLILLAYAWVRGISFRHDALVEVAIRRFPGVLPWAAMILALEVLLIEVPLALKNFPALAEYFPESEVFDRWLVPARLGLSFVIVATAGVQVRLALHGVAWREALREHGRMLLRSWWPLGWFLVIAAIHFLAWNAVRANIARGVGEGTALWVAWQLVSPWLAALVGAWLLASWVCVYKRLDRDKDGLPVQEAELV